MRTLALLATVALGGCSATNVTELVKASANDPRSFCFKETSVYVNIQLSITGLHNGTVTCNADGTMQVKSSEPAVTNIPVTVTPATPNALVR